MKQFQFSYTEGLRNSLTEADQVLAAAADQAADSAYAPYSHFKVGASVRLSDGRILTGANHENASFPAGICAERAVLAGLDMRSGALAVEAIAVTYLPSRTAPAEFPPLSPCGLCRQTILEVQHRQKAPVRLLLCSPGDRVITVPDAEYLLPFSFGSAFLEKGRNG